MKLNAARLGYAAAGIVVIVAGIVAVLGRPSKAHPVPAATNPSAHSQPQKTKPATVTSGKRTSRAQKPKILKSAATTAIRFMEAYYLILPKDTVATRRRRIAPYVPAQGLRQLDLGLGAGTAANRARIKEQLTQKGKVKTSTIIVRLVTDQKNTVAAAVPVTVSVTYPNGKVVNRFTIQTDSRWTYRKGQWLLASFDEGGDSG